MNNKNKIHRTQLIVIFLMLCILFFLLIQAFKAPIYKQLRNGINLEVKRFKYIPNENEEDIIHFLGEKIYTQNIPVKAMDYIFKNSFENMNEENKFFLFAIYYENYNKYIDRFNRMLDDPVYQDYLYELNYYYDINDINIINRIDNITLRTILLDLRLNNLKIIMNETYPQIYFDYEMFLNKFEDILPKDYIEFVKLEFEGSKTILNPGYVEIDMDKIVWYLNSYKEFIETTEHEELKKSAISTFQKSLGLYLGTNEMGQYYTDTVDYKVSTAFINSYKDYIEDYPNNDLSDLIKDVLELIDERAGKGEDVLIYINDMIHRYFDNKGWLIG